MRLRRLFFLVALAGLVGPAARACPYCRPTVEAGVFDEGFAGTFALLMAPLVVIAVAGALLYFAPFRSGDDDER